jgi:DNA-binding MarR family transcriptional regulator
VTPTQYNVLRILRGAGDAGLCRNEVRDRMVAPVPDATRLLDRLEAAGLIRRERSVEDRRVVTTRISAEGLRLLEALDEPVQTLHRAHFGHLSGEELDILIQLLDRVRAAVSGVPVAPADVVDGSSECAVRDGANPSRSHRAEASERMP